MADGKSFNIIGKRCSPAHPRRDTREVILVRRWETVHWLPSNFEMGLLFRPLDIASQVDQIIQMGPTVVSSTAHSIVVI